MLAVLLRFTLSFIYKVYIGFLSCMRDWTVAVAQYSKFSCSSTVYLKIRLYNNLDMFTYLLTMYCFLTNVSKKVCGTLTLLSYSVPCYVFPETFSRRYSV